MDASKKKLHPAGAVALLVILLLLGIAFGYDALRYKQLSSTDFQGTAILPEVQPSGEVLLRAQCTSNDFLTVLIIWKQDGEEQKATHRILLSGRVRQSSYQYTPMRDPSSIVVEVFNDDPQLSTDTCHVELVKKRW